MTDEVDPRDYFAGKAYIRKVFAEVHHGAVVPKRAIWEAATIAYAEVNDIPRSEVTRDQMKFAVAHYEDEILDLVL